MFSLLIACSDFRVGVNCRCNREFSVELQNFWPIFLNCILNQKIDLILVFRFLLKKLFGRFLAKVNR